MNRHERRKQAAENRQAAQAASNRDFVNSTRRLKEVSSEHGVDCKIVGFDDDFGQYGDGSKTMIAINIGARGRLTTKEAKVCADAWHKAVASYPKGIFCPTILGYDEDPRELWEFEDVREYVRQWT